MATQLFRQEVIEAGRDRLTGAVVAAVPPGSRLYTALLTATIGAIVAMLVFGTYASRVQVRRSVAQGSGIAEVSTPSAAQVREVHVAEGMKVAKGTPLVTISLTQGRDPGGEGVAGRLAEIDRQDAELARQQGLASSLGTTDTSGLEQQKAGLAAAI